MKFKTLLVAILAAYAMIGCGQQNEDNFIPDNDNMLPAASNMWSGVKVFDVENAGSNGEKRPFICLIFWAAMTASCATALQCAE